MAHSICKICISPYRDELLTAWNKGFSRKMLYEKYKFLIWTEKEIRIESFHNAIYTHIKEHKKNQDVMIVQAKDGQLGKDITDVAKMVTDLYARKIRSMTPEDITAKDYQIANKLVLEEKKLKLSQGDQMLALAKLFGRPEVISPLDAIDAEYLPGKGKKKYARLRSPKNR